MADVFSRVDWALRSAEFGPLEIYAMASDEELVVMPLRTPGLDDANLNWGLWDQWSAMPRHPTLFDAISSRGPGEILLQFAAIDWTWKPESIERTYGVRDAAMWGVELAAALEYVRMCVRDADLGWFTCPFAKVDIHGRVRMGFLNPAGSIDLMQRVPPEVLGGFPAADERSLVFAVGQLMLGLVEITGKASRTPLGLVLLRCLAKNPTDRFASLAELRKALWIIAATRYRPSPYESVRAWRIAEQAIGFKLLDRQERAAILIANATRFAPYGALDELIRELGLDPRTIAPAAPPASSPRVPSTGAMVLVPAQRTRNWRDVRATARMHIEAGRYADALALYNTSVLADADASEILLGTAECHLLAREYGTAVDFAERALARDPKIAQAHSILAEARFKRRELEQALAAVNLWTTALPADGHAHYVGAKALLGLGRLAEAREACERALELAPKHLPAMMLRRQIDRTIQRVRVQAGMAQHVPVDLPEHLRDLRPLLVAGKTAEAIAVLERPAYANDPTARLLRADLLAFTEQLEEAETAYAALGGVAAAVGRVLVLVKLGRAKDALAVADELVKEHPGAAEAHEARALALQQLGRGNEADDEMRRAVAADRQRSQMRVNLAKR